MNFYIRQIKLWFKQSDVFNSVYIMNKLMPQERLETIVRDIFADKIYSDFSFWGNKQQEQGVTMMTPVKAIKGEEPIITQREKAGRDLFSTAVSKVRQPIESFFNWLNEKTNIQRAMKVRSTSGLLVHTMGKIAIAFIYLIFLNKNQSSTTDSHYLLFLQIIPL